MSIVVNGLNSNGYLIGNPIVIEVSDNANPIEYIELAVVNLTTGISSAVLKAYAGLNNKLLIDIAPTVKSVFSQSLYKLGDSLTSMNRVQVMGHTYHIDGDTSEFSQIKNFIRGWKTQEYGGAIGDGTVVDPTLKNKTLPKNKWIKIAEREPIWAGFPKKNYYIDNDYNITDTPASAPEIDFEDLIRPKGCNPFYVQFLNSNGGWSYFLLENIIDGYSNKPLPMSNNSFSKIDLGSEYNREYNAKAKVKLMYMPLIRDLIFSNEVYAWEKGMSMTSEHGFNRIKNLGNNIIINHNEKTADVNLKFEDFAIVNPSLL